MTGLEPGFPATLENLENEINVFQSGKRKFYHAHLPKNESGCDINFENSSGKSHVEIREF